MLPTLHSVSPKSGDSDFVFKIKLNLYGMLYAMNIIFTVEINDYRGELTDVSATTDALRQTHSKMWFRSFHRHQNYRNIPASLTAPPCDRLLKLAHVTKQ